MGSRAPFLLARDRAALLIIDLQERLFKAMPEAVQGQMIRNMKLLVAVAAKMGLPVLVTEQYPQGLGPTLSEVREPLPTYDPIAKMAFSSWREPAFSSRLRELGSQNLILTGMEAHVCCLQTAVDLLDRDYGVYVAGDAVCSRRKSDWQGGLDLMRQAGAVISTAESLVFQLLERADTEEFRFMQPLIKAASN